MGVSEREISDISAFLPSIFNSKFSSFSVANGLPSASVTDTGIGTSDASTLMISLSSVLGAAVVDGRLVGISFRSVTTDGPAIERGVGVGLGFFRPDWPNAPALQTAAITMSKTDLM